MMPESEPEKESGVQPDVGPQEPAEIDRPEIHLLHHGRRIRPELSRFLSCLEQLSERFRFVLHAESDSAFGQVVRERGIEVFEYPVPAAYRLGALVQWRAQISARIEPRGRLVMALSSAVGVSGARIARRLRLPFLWRLEDDSRMSPRHAVLRRLSRGYLASASAILEQAGIPAGHPYSRVVPHAMTPEDLDVAFDPKGHETVTVGMHGAFENRAGHHLFLAMARAVAKQRPRTQFLIAGDIGIDTARRRRSYADLLGHLVRQWGLEGRVHFVVPRVLREFVDQLDLFVVPATRDGSGFPATLAMARGIPVLGTRVGPLPELIESGDNGWLVPPRDPRALIQACRFLTGSPDIAGQIGARGQVTIRNASALRSVSERLGDVFDEFLAGSIAAIPGPESS